MKTKAYAAKQPKKPLELFEVERRKIGENDVEIDIHFCGVCHSDIHQVRDEWKQGIYPMVPGHEIIGIVKSVGKAVKKFKVSDRVGVGCFVDSCRSCTACHEGLEQFCEQGMIETYNGKEKNGSPTYGGYSKKIVVDESYVLKIPDNLALAAAAPLLCAGITTYSPLKNWKIKKGDKVGVMGLGGLGHMAVKLAQAMGAEVTVISTSDKKENDAKRLGATHFVNSKNGEAVDQYVHYFDLLINTISANIDLDYFLNLLKLDGTMVLVGAPSDASTVNAFPLIMRRRSLAGSLIGGIKETQEMLDFCSKHDITSDIELIPIQEINNAYERMIKGDVRYRFVIDMQSL